MIKNNIFLTIAAAMVAYIVGFCVGRWDKICPTATQPFSPTDAGVSDAHTFADTLENPDWVEYKIGPKAMKRRLKELDEFEN